MEFPITGGRRDDRTRSTTVTRTGLSILPELTSTTCGTCQRQGFRMPMRTIELPKDGCRSRIDGCLETEFSTREGGRAKGA